MIDLGTYKDRFAESGQRVLEHAVQESRRRDQNYIAVEHILNGLAIEEADLFNSTMRDLSLDPRSVKVLIEKRLENARYQNVNKGIRIAPETRTPVALLQLPLGLNLPIGAKLQVDEGKTVDLQIQTCENRGCYASTPIAADLLAALRSGKQLKVSFQNMAKETIAIPMPLGDFAAAYDKIK